MEERERRTLMRAMRLSIICDHKVMTSTVIERRSRDRVMTWWRKLNLALANFEDFGGGDRVLTIQRRAEKLVTVLHEVKFEEATVSAMEAVMSAINASEGAR